MADYVARPSGVWRDSISELDADEANRWEANQAGAFSEIDLLKGRTSTLEAASVGIVVLNAGDPIPTGLSDGTIVLRRTGGGATLLIESWTGTSGSGWPLGWSAEGVSATVQGGAGQLVTGAYPSATGGAFHDVPGAADVELLVKWQPDTNPLWFITPLIRAGSDGDGYGLMVTPTVLEIQVWTGGVPVAVSADATVSIAAATWYWARFRAVGASLSGRVWADGTTEPSSWQVSASDATYTGGGVALRVAASAAGAATTALFDALTYTSAS